MIPKTTKKQILLSTPVSFCFLYIICLLGFLLKDKIAEAPVHLSPRATIFRNPSDLSPIPVNIHRPRRFYRFLRYLEKCDAIRRLRSLSIFNQLHRRARVKVEISQKVTVTIFAREFSLSLSLSLSLSPSLSLSLRLPILIYNYFSFM